MEKESSQEETYSLDKFLKLLEQLVNSDERIIHSGEVIRLDRVTYKDYATRIEQAWPQLRLEAYRRGAAVDTPLEFALKELKPNARALAYLNPSRIWSFDKYETVDMTTHHLDTRNLQSVDILQCWQYRDGLWQDCVSKWYLEYRGSIGSKWKEFSILQKQKVAYIIWESRTQVLDNRCSGRSGTWVLKKMGNAWVELPGLGEMAVI